MSELESKKDLARKNFIFRNRKASKEENQVLIERIDSLSEAAKLRNILSDKSPESFHNPIEFSWKAFWKTFIYENLPPVFLSPLAALILEGSPSRAWNVSQNRNLIALSTQHMPLLNIIVSWLITYPGSWLLTSAFILALFILSWLTHVYLLEDLLFVQNMDFIDQMSLKDFVILHQDGAAIKQKGNLLEEVGIIQKIILD